MVSKNITEVLDLVEPITNGLKMDIKNVSYGTDKFGAYATIETTSNKKYRTYSGVVIETLKRIAEAKGFAYGKDTITCTVMVKESESGNTYFTLTA